MQSRFENRNTRDVSKETKNKGKKVFFEKTEDDTNQDYIRRTYHLSNKLIQAIAIMGAMEGKEKSEIVREALKEYIPEKYFNM